MKFVDKHFIEIATLVVFLILLGMWAIFQVPFLERLAEAAFVAFLTSLGLRKATTPQQTTNIDSNRVEVTQNQPTEEGVPTVTINEGKQDA